MSRKRDLYWFYIFTICWAFNPTSGLWILYLLHCHWTLFQVGLGEAGFHVVSFLSDVPTGLFADRWGRRKSLAFGLAVQALTTGATLLLAPRSVVLGLLSVSLGALAWSFIGGADRALLFGIVVQDDEGSAFGRAYGTTLAVNLAVRALATALGGWMVTRAGWYMPYGLAILTALLGLLVTRALPEGRATARDAKPSFGHMAEDLRNALGSVQQRPGLPLWILLGAGLATMVTINNLYAQSTLVMKGAPLGIASLLVAAASIVTALGSWVGGRLDRRREIPILSIGALFLGTAVAAVGLLPLREASFGYLGAAGVDGMLDPLYEAALNRLAPEEHRATILSLPSTGFSLGMMVLFPMAGWAMGAHHLETTYIFIGFGLYLLAVGFVSAGFRRRRFLKAPSE